MTYAMNMKCGNEYDLFSYFSVITDKNGVVKRRLFHVKNNDHMDPLKG